MLMLLIKIIEGWRYLVIRKEVWIIFFVFFNYLAISLESAILKNVVFS